MIHEAGPLGADGVQRCTRCQAILADYRGAMVPVGQEPLRGWADGAAVEVITGNPTYSGTTTDRPDCKPEPCDLECGDRWFKGRRCRHGRTPEQMH